MPTDPDFLLELIERYYLSTQNPGSRARAAWWARAVCREHSLHMPISVLGYFRQNSMRALARHHNVRALSPLRARIL